jgi:hypothetical protein
MRAWVASMAEASPMGDGPKFECVREPYGCLGAIDCKINGKADERCIVTNCGEGKCGMCPEFLSKLLIKGWCSYKCRDGDKTVGGAFILKTHFGKDRDNGPWCIDKNGKIYDKDGKSAW